jgi:large subunit ribosomal protein L4
MKVTVFNAKGEKSEEAKDLKLNLFDEVVNPALIHEVVVAQLANKREAAAKAKTRAEVAGGGKKPYKQKGTGRARTGSIRNPLWRGGGVVFGPTGLQNFSQKILKKKKKAAILSALATRKDSVVILEELKVSKTKDFASLLAKVSESRNNLFVFDGLKENDILVTRNIEGVRVCDYRNLNTVDVLRAEKLVFVGEALTKANEFWGAK